MGAETNTPLSSNINKWIEKGTDFKTLPEQLQRYVLHWVDKMVLSKRGRPRLRHFLYLVTMCMVITNSEVRALHHYNVKEKKVKKMKSIMKLIGKVARMLVCLAKSGKTYDSTRIFLQAA